MTAAVAALAAIVRANALLEVARFNPFTPDNHPYCGHDPPPFARGFPQIRLSLIRLAGSEPELSPAPKNQDGSNNCGNKEDDHSS